MSADGRITATAIVRWASLNPRGPSGRVARIPPVRVLWRPRGCAARSPRGLNFIRSPLWCSSAALALLVAYAKLADAEPIVSAVGLVSRVIFTDNLYLQKQGNESAAILQLLPNISGGGEGSRANYRYYYGPSALIYGGYPELNRVFQVFQGNAQVDVIKDYFGLVFSANANQNLVNPAAENVGFTALGNPGAFAQTATLSVTPVITFPLRGDFATVRVSPGINYVFSSRTLDNGVNSGSTGAQSSLTITSGRKFSRLRWRIAAYSNLFNIDNRAQDTQGNGTSLATLTLTYPFTDQWRMEGLVGYDWGDYQTLSGASLPASSSSATGGSRWRLTPYWSPSKNTSIGLGFGQRYYGDDYYANIRRVYKNSVLNVSYESVVSNARTSLLGSNPVSFQDPFGQPITNPAANQLLSGSTSNPALTSGVFVQYQLLANIAYRFRRSTVVFALTRNRLDYQDSNKQVTDAQGNLVFTRDLSRRARAQLGLQYWDYSQSALDTVDFNQFQLWSDLSYRVSRRLTGDVRYSYSQRSSATPTQNYDENSLWLTLNWKM